MSDSGNSNGEMVIRGSHNTWSIASMGIICQFDKIISTPNKCGTYVRIITAVTCIRCVVVWKIDIQPVLFYSTSYSVYCSYENSALV